MGKIISYNNQKKAGVALLGSYKIDIRTKKIARDSETSYNNERRLLSGRYSNPKFVYTKQQCWKTHRTGRLKLGSGIKPEIKGSLQLWLWICLFFLSVLLVSVINNRSLGKPPETWKLDSTLLNNICVKGEV